MTQIEQLRRDYPWTKTPLIVGAPMRLIALADLAVEISKAGGIGFIGAGTDVSDLSNQLSQAKELLQHLSTTSSNDTLPIGAGFINWGAYLETSVAIIKEHRPAAVWFFAPSSIDSLLEWTLKSREASPGTKIWVQVGSVKEALDVMCYTRPDVLVVQGTDAGGHGLVQGASLITLLPEVCDAVERVVADMPGYEAPILIAAGGIIESRGAAAAFSLGASGVVLGTRLLASPEANIAKGYQNEVLGAYDGGQTTVRTKVYDTLRGTNWAHTHNARGIINKSHIDAVAGMDEEENKHLYLEETRKGDEGWGVNNRMTTYAGSGVGLVTEIKPAGEIVREIKEGVSSILEKSRSGL